MLNNAKEHRPSPSDPIIGYDRERNKGGTENKSIRQSIFFID